MKKFFSLISFASFALLATSLLGSCDPKTPQVEAIAEVAATGTSDEDYPATSVGVKFNFANIESYVYTVEEGENKPTPDPTMMFAEAKLKTPAKDGASTAFIYGVEGSKSYTIHFAFKVLGENRMLSKSINTKTGAYNRLINIISADQFEIKVQFNVPENQHFMYIIRDHAGYHDGKQTGDDITTLHNGILKKGPQVISYADGQPTGIVDPETGEKQLALVKPGGAFVVIMAYCNDKGEIDYKGGDRPWETPQYKTLIRPDQKGYTEECDDKHYAFKDKYAKTFVTTAQPAIGEGVFAVDMKITELSSIFKVTPPPSVKKYGAMVLPLDEYTNQEKVLGENGVVEYIQRQMKPLSGEQVISNSLPLVKDVTYRLILIGQCDDQGMVQIRNVYDFKPAVSSKPAPKIVITALTDQTDGPYQVRFNIKATNKDCYAAKYILNYVKDVEGMLGSGLTYDDLMFTYGKPMADDLIDQINSDGGLTLPFDSFEDMDNRLIVGAFNEDEKYETTHADSRSAIEPAKPHVGSELFNSLIGTWKVKAKFHYTELETPEVMESEFFTTISAGPQHWDPNFQSGNPEYEQVLMYYRMQEEMKGTPADQIEANALAALNVELEKYKVASPKFEKKYRDQNRLVLNGFEYNKDGYGLQYQSSWNLFCNTTYSSYDVDQLFFDYGPKLFIEIAQGDVVTLETNQQYIAPFNYHSTYTMAGGFAENTAAYGKFPVTVVDKDNLVIKNETVVEGRKFPFAIINGNNKLAETIFDADITLTRVNNSAKLPAVDKTRKDQFAWRAVTPSVGGKLKRTKLYQTTVRSAKGNFETNNVVLLPEFKGLSVQ